MKRQKYLSDMQYIYVASSCLFKISVMSSNHRFSLINQTILCNPLLKGFIDNIAVKLSLGYNVQIIYIPKYNIQSLMAHLRLHPLSREEEKNVIVLMITG